MQIVFPFQLLQYGHGTVIIMRVADLPTVLTAPQRYDMEILAGDVPESFVGLFVRRRRIQ